MSNILVTGGAGYIGSHTCVELLASGYEVVVYDNFSNSCSESLNRVARITGKTPVIVDGDIRDRALLERTLKTHACSAVIHFAGLKAVGESIEKPLQYYENNVSGTVSLLNAMGVAGVKTLVFSSSANVYGEPEHLPIAEDHRKAPTNPYGRSKAMIEDILADLPLSPNVWRIGMLRYFNPVGAHESGLMGEDPLGIPNNLMPLIAQVAAGRRPEVNVWGSDYPTPDGTGVRDYIHVVDLAKGHLKALQYLAAHQSFCVNLGTGRGHSVLQLIAAFERACGKPIPYRLAPRRAGDAAVSYADPTRAERLLGWRAERDIEAMCSDTWRWQSQNPAGYRG